MIKLVVSIDSEGGIKHRSQLCTFYYFLVSDYISKEELLQGQLKTTPGFKMPMWLAISLGSWQHTPRQYQNKNSTQPQNAQ